MTKVFTFYRAPLEGARRCFFLFFVTDLLFLTPTADEHGGLVLNAQSRALLMAKLQQRGNPTAMPSLVSANMPGLVSPAPRPGVPPGIPSSVAGIPSPCILLKNMFDPATYVFPIFTYFLDISDTPPPPSPLSPNQQKQRNGTRL